MKRAEGYYWVREYDSWLIMKWWIWDYDDSYEDGGYWKDAGSEIEWYDSDFTEIDENRIVRSNTLNDGNI
jgi:hypothetical protein